MRFFRRADLPTTCCNPIFLPSRIDAKSFATYRGAKFKKSDIINRILKFEGAALMQSRGKMTAIVVVVLSDILFFLAERDQKYAFFVPDNKAGIVSLQKLLVREKAGQESSIYLISSNPAEPEMFELKIQKPKDKQLWIRAIRSAVEACPQESEENEADTLTENSNELRDTRSSSISLVSTEEKQRIAKAKESLILKIVGTSLSFFFSFFSFDTSRSRCSRLGSVARRAAEEGHGAGAAVRGEAQPANATSASGEHLGRQREREREAREAGEGKRRLYAVAAQRRDRHHSAVAGGQYCRLMIN